MTSSERPHFAEDEFRKATASNPNQECVRVARLGGWVELRDDKTQFAGPYDLRILLTAAEFDELEAGVRSGKSDGLPLQLALLPDGTYNLRSMRPQPTTLTFTGPEIHSFLAGVHAHEFDLARYEQSTTAA